MNRYYNKTGAEIIRLFLNEKGVKNVFGFTGGAVLSLTDQFHSSHKSGIKHITNRTEAAAGHSAEGYARATGELGVVVSTSGPGVTNLVTPLQNATSDGYPLLAISGQVSTHMIGKDAFQECRATDITKPATKWSNLVVDVNDLPDMLEMAYNLATTPRYGAVHLDIPKDVFSSIYNREQDNIKKISVDSAMVNDITPVSFVHESSKKAVESKQLNKSVNQLCKLINNSQRPVIIVGRGAVDSYIDLRKFISKTPIPVTSTLHGMGVFDETHELSLHMLGMHGSAYANYTVQNADLIISLGSRFDDRVIGTVDTYAPEAHLGIVHVDNCSEQFNKNIKTTLNIHCDVGKLLKLLNRRRYNIKNKTEWYKKIKMWKMLFPFEYEKTKNICVQEVIDNINSHIEPDTIVTTGVGNHQMFTAQFINWRKPNKIFTSGSSGTMGTGLPFAIGATIANNSNRVISIDGDSSFMMSSGELGTVKQYNLPITMFVMDDMRQQMVYIWQKLFFNGNIIATENHNPDFVKLAESYDIPTYKINDREDLTGIKDIISMKPEDGPILIHVKSKPDICLPLVAPGKALNDMILRYNVSEFIGTGEPPN